MRVLARIYLPLVADRWLQSVPKMKKEKDIVSTDCKSALAKSKFALAKKIIK